MLTPPRPALASPSPSLSPLLDSLDPKDVCDEAARSAFFAALDTLEGGAYKEVDILVNNAGLAVGKAPAYQPNAADQSRMIATNVTALIGMTSLFLPGMVSRKRGHLINISSIAAHDIYPGGKFSCRSHQYDR